MKRIIALLLLLTGCASASNIQAFTPYMNECQATDNYGEIDARDLADPTDKTTFHAVEYVDCAGGRNLVVISWTGALTSADVDLAEQVFDNFIGHFHHGEQIRPVNSSAHTQDDTHFIMFEIISINGTSI